MHALKSCFISSIKNAPGEIKLKRFTTQGYIGLFLEEDIATWFRELMKNFAVECRAHGMCIVCTCTQVGSVFGTMYMYMCMYKYIYMYVHVNVHVYMCICTCVCTCVHVNGM